jgi:beta-glucanase (GH16 family)
MVKLTPISLRFMRMTGISSTCIGRVLALTRFAFVSILATGCGGGAAGTIFPPPTQSPNVIFFDDFMGTTLDTTKWMAMNRAGDYSNNEQECYDPSQVSVSGSSLVITSIAPGATCGDANHAPSQFPTVSGMVQWKTFNFTYGTVEFRAKMAGGQGTWPAVWLLGASCQQSNITTADNIGTCNWPQPGSDEIDITEILGSNHTSPNQQIHSGGNNNGCTATTTDVSQSYHVYQLVWTSSSLEWKIDGTSTCKLTSNIPSNPMFLIINTAMGGAGGPIDSATLPQMTTVDYVKVTLP